MRGAIRSAFVALALCLPASAPARITEGEMVKWRPIGPGLFGAMFGVAISPHDPKVIVAGGDMGNAFITRDGGEHWTIVGRSDGIPFANPGYRGVWAVHFDPKRPGRIWVGSTHGLYLSTDNGYHWRLVLGGGAEYAIAAITTDPTDPDIVYAATGNSARFARPWVRGDLWKSVDGGLTWRVTRPTGARDTDPDPNRNWVTIAVDPQGPFTPHVGHSRVYASGQGGFFASEDAGGTWSSLEEFLPGGRGRVGSDGSYTSGITGIVLAPGRDRARIFASIGKRQSGTAEAGAIGGVYVSDDGGRTWVARNHGLEETLRNMDGEYGYYALLVGSTGQASVMYWANMFGVFRTEDAGGNWHQVTDLATDWVQAADYDGRTVWWRLRRNAGNYDRSFYNAYGPANGLACCATDPDVVAVCDNAGIAISYDGGAHWTEPGFEFGEALWPGAFGDRPPMVLTHETRSKGLQLTVPRAIAVDPFDSNTIAIGHLDTGLHISRDDGNWWEWAYRGILKGERNEVYAVLYDPQVRGRLWVAGGGWGGFGHVYETEDGGRTFRVVGIPALANKVATTGAELRVLALALDPRSPSGRRTLYAATDDGIYRTTDGCETWERPSTGLEAIPHVNHIIVDPVAPERIYATAAPGPDAGPGGGVYRSDDAGQSWKQVGRSLVGAVRSLSVCDATGAVYALARVSGQAGRPDADELHLFRSGDHGETWREIRVPAQHGACAAVSPRDPDRVYFVSRALDVRTDEVNVWRSTDGGHSWTAIADGIALSPGGEGNQIVFDPQNPSRLFILHNSGVYEGREP
jgi:photosystem II stability/assembly factor-like uncharacterized protein